MSKSLTGYWYLTSSVSCVHHPFCFSGIVPQARHRRLPERMVPPLSECVWGSSEGGKGHWS